MSIKTLNALFLAGALSLAAASAAQATEGPGGPTDGTGRSHASAAPACDGTGRAQKPVHGRASGKECALLATDDGPPGVGEGNGCSAELNSGGSLLLLASIKAGQGDFGH